MHSCNYTLCVSVLVLPGAKKSLIQMHYYCHMQVDGQIGDRAPRIKKKVNESSAGPNC